MAQPINVNSREFWTNYVTTAQYEAGTELGLNPVQGAVQRAKEANVIQEQHRPNIANYNPIIINYSPWNWSWGSNNVVNNAQPAQRSQEERDAESASQAAIIGTIFAIVGAFLATYTYKKYLRQEATCRRSLEVAAALPRQPAIPRQAEVPIAPGADLREVVGAGEDPLLENIRVLVGHQRAIDELNTARIHKYAIAAIMLFGGGFTLAIGGFAAIPVLMTMGKIALLASALIAAGTLGWHWDDSETLRPSYEAIVSRNNNPNPGLADRILINLPTRPENNVFRLINQQNAPAGAPQDNPPAYQPLYPIINGDGLQQWIYAQPAADAPPAYAIG